jgi:hypothetical protein
MAGPATRSVTLVVQMQSNFSSGIVDGFRITGSITAVDSFDDMDLFRYEQLPAVTPGGSATNVFSGVCSPIDLQEFPTVAPLPDANPPYFRASTFDLVFRTRDEGMLAVTAVQDDLTRLVVSMNIMDVLGPGQTTVIGPFPTS